jgi:hypothetical protein
MVVYLKRELTEEFKYNGHTFMLYPHDSPEAHCKICNHEFSIPHSNISGREREKIKQYMYGWAAIKSCEERMKENFENEFYYS